MGFNSALRAPARRSPRRLLARITVPAVAAGLLVSALPAQAATAAVPVAVRAGQVFVNGQPSLGGDPSVGGLLTADVSRMQPFATSTDVTPTITFRWTRSGITIPGVTGTSYRASAVDLGRDIAVHITVTYDAETTMTFQAGKALRVAAASRARGFDGDGTLDIFARDAAGRLLLYPTDGRGNWRAPQVIGNGWHIYNLMVSPGDFDGDGTVDVMGRDGYGRLFLYQGNGAGAWKQAFQIGQGWQGFAKLIAPGDFNGDGTNDILAQDAAGTVFLYPGNGKGGWLAPTQVTTGWQGLDAAGAGHFFGDAYPVVLSRAWWGDLQVRVGNRTGSFMDGGNPGSYAGSIGRGWDALSRFGVAGDFNGDGSVDVYGISANGLLTMYLGDTSDVNYIGIISGFKWKGQPVVGSGWNVMNAVF